MYPPKDFSMRQNPFVVSILAQTSLIVGNVLDGMQPIEIEGRAARTSSFEELLRGELSHLGLLQEAPVELSEALEGVDPEMLAAQRDTEELSWGELFARG
ncbi:hypothetical protein COX00_04695 [Candidatus Uhrbacteria bacterium CG22_combo_CG10-13_8_21_14_all_47_17]|uniref:Uncharacterized protein n=1 Tax=Candidatus Uhrbacteria bacterium CG22_combo_CG10-13_8_21_14_all_47_17 TaxID=1975041 RepID=A0A2H0BRA4_9BACT|nr:MAG: hypothetical protein COX00_04695 [Candidatus Uhrbacteria bacterium CG22_combo_CG10-13_8_21_14_all_47_17]